MVTVDKFTAFKDAELMVTGRLVDASNATLFAHVVYQERQLHCIYKPIAGERPLWDFLDGCLAHREFAAYCISQYLDLRVVPFTVLREGPYGMGMVQEWIEVDQTVELAVFFASDHPRLRTMALFDAIINNTDRKVGHILPVDKQEVFGCDHGLTFHVDDKLRTVLWQWAGDDFNQSELQLLKRASDGLVGELRDILQPWLTRDEIDALKLRIDKLRSTKKFPAPNPNWPAVPWPAF